MISLASSSAPVWIFILLVAAGVGIVPMSEEIPVGVAGLWADQESPSQVKGTAGWLAGPNAPFWIFIFLVAAGFGIVPMPEEIPVCFAGLWASHNHIIQTVGTARWLVLPMCIFGVVISDGMLYGIGRIWGTRLLETRFFRKMVPPEKKERIEKNIQKHGIKVLLFARLLPGIRSPIFITAGTMRLPLPTFILADLIYAIPGVSLLFFLSYAFGDTFFELIKNVEEKASYVRNALILGAIIAVVVYLLYRFLRHPVSEGDPEEDLPHLPLPLHPHRTEIHKKPTDAEKCTETKVEEDKPDESSELRKATE